MHPLLAPGTHVLRRGPRQLQAGLGVGAACPLPPSVATAADATTRPEALTALLAAGLAIPDDRAVRAALPPATTGSAWPRHTLAALARRQGDRVATAAAARSCLVVRVVPFGHPVAADLAGDVEALCLRSGLRLAGQRRPVRSSATASLGDRPLQVLIGVGEPRRALLDRPVREGVPHLLVRLVEGAAVIGPLVVPGRTACLRCWDAARTDGDPAWPLLVEQYARRSRADRPDGIPEPVDAALAAVAVGWALREVATYAEGGRPATLGATLTLDPALERLVLGPADPHPDCGCCDGSTPAAAPHQSAATMGG